MFFPLNHAPQWLLDGLLKADADRTSNTCHDCGAKPGEKHRESCDVARCLKCGGQYLSCGCKDGYGDVWTGLWPGVQECHDKGYVCYDTATGQIMFDLNRLAEGKELSDKDYARKIPVHGPEMNCLQSRGMGGLGWGAWH